MSPVSPQVFKVESLVVETWWWKKVREGSREGLDLIGLDLSMLMGFDSGGRVHMSRTVVISRIWEWSWVDSHQENQFIPPPTPHPALRDTVWWIIWSVDCATWKLGVRIYSMEMLGLELGRQHFRLPWESGLWGGGQEPGFIQACSKGQEIWIMRFLLTREN